MAMSVPLLCCVSQTYVLLIGKSDMQMSTLMERLRARSLHHTSWMETVKGLNTTLSTVSIAVSLSCFWHFSSFTFLRKCRNIRFESDSGKVIEYVLLPVTVYNVTDTE